jgi:hypothetical protein
MSKATATRRNGNAWISEYTGADGNGSKREEKSDIV